MSNHTRRSFLAATGVGAGVAVGLTGGVGSTGTMSTGSFDGTVTDASVVIDASSPDEEALELLLDGDTARIDGTVSGDGTWESTGTSWPGIEPDEEPDIGELDIDIEVVGTVDGILDRQDGVMTADLQLDVIVELCAFGSCNEFVVEIDGENLTTEDSNEMSGSSQGLDTTSGSVRLVDNELTIPSTGESAIDDVFDIPSQTEGRNWLELEMDLELPHPNVGSLSGTVTDTDETPLPDITLSFAEVESETSVGTTTTDGDGAYAVELPAELLEVSVEEEGYYEESTTISLDPGESAELDFVIEEIPTATVTGTVTDRGDPIAGATVEAVDTVSDSLVERHTTDDSGEYAVTIEAHRIHEVTATADGYDSKRTLVSLDNGEVGTEDIDLGDIPDPGQVVGVVSDEHSLVGGATVEILETETGGVLATTTSAVDGSYSIEVQPGEYDIRFTHDGYPATVERVTVLEDELQELDAELVTLPPIVGDTPPRDPDGDGLYEDIDGDGTVDIFDVQALFTNLQSDAVQEYAEFYNFAGDDDEEVTIFDVQALFVRLP